jgi:hypothetical protein
MLTPNDDTTIAASQTDNGQADASNQIDLEFDYTQKDAFLTSLVDMANEGTASMGLTLFVSGTIISGTLIGAKQFFNELADLIVASELTPSAGDSPFSASLRELGGDIENSAKASALVPHYIHLKDARVVNLSELNSPSTLWRGRLAQIDGFSLGVWKKSS